MGNHQGVCEIIFTFTTTYRSCNDNFTLKSCLSQPQQMVIGVIGIPARPAGRLKIGVIESLDLPRLF